MKPWLYLALGICLVPRESAAGLTDGMVSPDQLPGSDLPRVARDTGEGRPAARFPLRPRLLFSPWDLKEAKGHVDVLPPLGTGASVLSGEGGALESEGIRVTVPPDALGAFAAGSLRALNATGFARLRRDSAGILTNAEPASPPLLPGLDAAQGMVQCLVRTAAGDPVPGIGVRLTGQSWLSVNGAEGRYFLTFPAGQDTVLASNSNNGDEASAAFNMPSGLAALTVNPTLGSVAPPVFVTTPAHEAAKVAVGTPLMLGFPEKPAPSSLGSAPLTLCATGASADRPAGSTLNLSNHILTLLP